MTIFHPFNKNSELQRTPFEPQSWPKHLLLLSLFVATPCLYLVTGEWAFERGFGWLKKEGRPEWAIQGTEFLLAYLLGGLLLNLVLVFALACLGVPLWLSVLFSFTPLAFLRRRVPFLLKLVRPVASLNFALWCTAILLLGVTLVGTTEGYQTAWRNNYADFVWHLGMISNFTFGENFPPQNHIFPPLALAYPFLINLWSSTLWVFDPKPIALGWIVIYQWVFLWTVIYFALNGNRWPVLPWAVLFGGGSYQFIFRTIDPDKYPQFSKLGPYAYDLLNDGYPWVPFLDSIWVPQRPTLIGAAVLLTSMLLGHGALFGEGKVEREKRTFCAGLLLALSPLAHTHFFLTAVCYLTLIFSFEAFRAESRREHLKLLSWFLIGLFPAVLSAPWIIGKSGIIRIAGAWMQDKVYEQSGLYAALVSGAKMWWSNGLLWLVLTIVALILGRRVSMGLALLLLFVAGNIIQISVWNWDEMKVFIAIYLISMSIWQTLPSTSAQRTHWLLLFLLAPACVEFGVVLSRYEMFTIYNKEELANAERIRELLPVTAVIAAKPDHNSPITLTGRKLYYGYEGTLSSHGIPFQERQEIQTVLSKLKSCRNLPEKPFCPDYLYWTSREKDYWKTPSVGEAVEATELPFLYRLK